MQVGLGITDLGPEELGLISRRTKCLPWYVFNNNDNNNNNNWLHLFRVYHVAGPVPRAFSMFPHLIFTVTQNTGTLFPLYIGGNYGLV